MTSDEETGERFELSAESKKKARYAAHAKAYHEANREQILARQKAYRAANRKRIQEYDRKNKCKYKYKIDPSAVAALTASQGNRCGICKVSLTLIGPHIDHCHKNGQVRGILCGRCNSGIGFLNDDPKIILAAIKYLKHHALKSRSCTDGER